MKLIARLIEICIHGDVDSEWVIGLLRNMFRERKTEDLLDSNCMLFYARVYIIPTFIFIKSFHVVSLDTEIKSERT